MEPVAEAMVSEYEPSPHVAVAEVSVVVRTTFQPFASLSRVASSFTALPETAGTVMA